MTTASAQASDVTKDGGFQPNRDYLALLPWESIDTSGGNVVLTFTDLELPGDNGRSLRFTRTFNNTVTSAELATQWRFSIGDVPLRVTVPQGPSVGTSLANTVAGERQFTPSFYMPDGSLQASNFMSDPDTSTSSQLAATTRWVITPAFWRYDRIAHTLYVPDGLVAQYDATGRLTSTYDRFGNTVGLTWGADVSGVRTLTVIQSVGANSRQIDIVLNSTLWLPVSMAFEGRTWTYTPDPNFPGKLVTAQPPSGRPWIYEYDSPTVRSNIRRVTTPQAGTVTYGYDVKTFITQTGTNQPETTSLIALVSRTANSGSASGTWTFDYLISGPGGVLAGMKAQLPDRPGQPARRVEYGYTVTGDELAVAGGWQLFDVSVYEGTSTTPIERERRTYQGIPAVRTSRVWYIPELRVRTTTRGTRTYETESVYNTNDAATFANFHRPSQVIERTGGQIRRTRNLNYQHLTGPLASPYVIGLVTAQEVIVGTEHNVSTWTYDTTTGFRTSATAQGSTTTFTQDPYGNVLRVTKGNAKWTEYTYKYGQMLATTTSEPGYGLTREVNVDGTVRSETQAGRTTTYQYDPLARVILVQRPGNTVPIETDYADLTVGQTITVRRGPVNAPETSFIVTTVDGFGRPMETVNSVGNHTRTIYDGEGRRTFVSLPFENNPSPTPGTSFTYDTLGRVAQEANADGSVRLRAYGDDTVTIRDENGHESVLSYGAFGHPDDAQLTGVRDANSQEWGYSYNVLGALTKVLSPDGITRTWTYDPNTFRLTSETHPESGTVTYTNYDGAGVLKERHDANGTTFTYQHDGNDRLKTVTATNASSGTRQTNITYETGSDNRMSIAAGTTSTTFSYDPQGRVKSRSDSADGLLPFVVSYDYDTRDRPEVVHYPSGRSVRYAYDSEGRIVGVSSAADSQVVYASALHYHPSGQLTSYVAGNGLATSLPITRNATGRRRSR